MEEKNISLWEQLKKGVTKNQEKTSKILNKQNLFIVIALYVAGMIVVFIRNSIVGLPFYNLSIVEYGILAVYFILFYAIYMFSDYVMNLIMKKDMKKWAKIPLAIILYAIIVAVLCVPAKFIYKEINVIIIFCMFAVTFFIIPLVRNSIEYKNIKLGLDCFMVVVFALFIMQIPATIGGLKPIDVVYVEHDTNKIANCEFYGIKDNIYLLKKDNRIYFEPIDSGYIRYEYKMEWGK